MDLTVLKSDWHSYRLWETTDVHRWIVLSTGANHLKSLYLTNIVHKRRPVHASAAEAAECGLKPESSRRNRGGSTPKYDSRPVARTVTTHVMDAN